MGTLVQFCAFAGGSGLSARFVSSAGMTPVLAALKYLPRCVVVNEFYKYGEAEECVERWKEKNVL